MIEGTEAREHLEMVDRIVERTSTRLNVGAEYFVVWGLASASMSLMYQLVGTQLAPANAIWIAWGAALAAMAFSIWRGRSARLERLTFLEREFLTVLKVAMMVTFFVFIIEIFGANLFGVTGLGAIWSFAASIVLFYIAMHGNRRALVGGIILLLSLAVANYKPDFVGYALSAGMFVGYAGFGAVELIASSRAGD
ncbi:MAG: hypothetical protein HKL92_08370 [Candidatus Eremiobacteraeota bacterium]|nr:hypothetical protein [Candidatus Eremiobacteraeota bacterium]